MGKRRPRTLQERCQELGITQVELAGVLKLSPSGLSLKLRRAQRDFWLNELEVLTKYLNRRGLAIRLGEVAELAAGVKYDPPFED